MDDQSVREWSQWDSSGRDGFGKGQSATALSQAEADEIDITDDILPCSFEVEGDMGTFPDCLPIISSQQLGHGIREVRSHHPCKPLYVSRTDSKPDDR